MTLMKWGVLGLFFGTAFALAYVVAADPESAPHRYYLRYIAYLDRKLHGMLMPMRGQWIVVGQLFCLELAGLLCVGIDDPRLYLGLPVALVAPVVYLEQLRKQRLAKIDKQVDGLLLTLANSLRATPSIGNALGYTQSLVESPTREELGLALQELRLGNSVDQALLNMGGRVKSPSLELALLGLLIGLQVGGNLTRILEDTAAALR
ncbi:MAG TPA: type II secretion system F family protein, partial [Polyangiaceae bacterium]|nr:type II secretion system F family protein [Polyangiaceae bacterium]